MLRMSNTAALDGQYQKVIPARFVTNRDGSPMPCVCCGELLTEGNAYAALTNTQPQGKWVSFCAECASNYPTQARRLYAKVCADVAAVDGAANDPNVVGAVTTAQDALRALVAAPGDATVFATAKSALFNVGKAIAPLAQAQFVASLAEDDEYVGLALFVQYCSARDREFAESMLRQWERKGALSPKQMVYVRRFAERGEKMAQDAAPDPDLPTGLYVSDDGRVSRIYVRQHRLLCRTYDGTTFEMERGGVKRVFDAVTAGMAHLMTHTEAHAFGVQHGRCFNCMAMGRPGELSDDRSLAAGYGERCAEIHGWHYPTAEEAATILRGKA
jgi:hypothetical protein